jgi:phosphatidylinositol alpha-mannosyltransferase
VKIAMVSPYDFAWPGGVNAHVSQLSGELRRRGHSVRVIAPWSGSMTDDGDGAGDQFIPMGRTVALSAGGSTARVSLSWWLYPRVRGLMARERFDVVHLHEPLAPLLPYLVLHHSRSVNIGTFHAYSDRQRLYRFSRPALGRLQRRLHGRIAVSPAAREFVAPHFPQHVYRVIPNGIEYERFATAQPFPHLRDGAVNILFVGRKDERKGLRYLLEAFHQMVAGDSRLRLVIVGPGEPDRECSRLLAAIAEVAPDRVVITGAVSDGDLPRYYASADVFCSPATGGESFGIVLLEAMAAGTPVVASDIDGYRDVVADGEQGLLTPPREPSAIADAIFRIIGDIGLSGRLAENGRRKASEYRWERIANDVENYYHKCIQEVGASGNPR